MFVDFLVYDSLFTNKQERNIFKTRFFPQKRTVKPLLNYLSFKMYDVSWNQMMCYKSVTNALC